MKRLFIVVMTLLIAGVLVLPSVVVATPPARVTGGGTVDPGALTQFGFSVTGDTGHFECLMAGLFDDGGDGFIDCPGDDCVMIVSGKVTSLDDVDDTSATFSGTARVILSDAYQDALGMPRIVEDVPFSVDVTEGGAGDGTLQLTIGPFPIVGEVVIGGTLNSGNIVIQP